MGRNGKHLEQKGPFLRMVAWLGSIPHLFSKLVVLWCVAFGTAASAYALRILARTGHDPAALLGVILAFFGGELMLLCLKKILGKNNNNDVQGGNT